MPRLPPRGRQTSARGALGLARARAGAGRRRAAARVALALAGGAPRGVCRPGAGHPGAVRGQREHHARRARPARAGGARSHRRWSSCRRAWPSGCWPSRPWRRCRWPPGTRCWPGGSGGWRCCSSRWSRPPGGAAGRGARRRWSRCSGRSAWPGSRQPRAVLWWMWALTLVPWLLWLTGDVPDLNGPAGASLVFTAAAIAVDSLRLPAASPSVRWPPRPSGPRPSRTGGPCWRSAPASRGNCTTWSPITCR